MSDEEAHARLRSYSKPKGHLLSVQWVVSMGLPRNWGVHHPLFVSKVLGEFPTESDGTLIALGTVEKAQLEVYYPTPSDRRTVGVDVARFGSDASVLTALHGKKSLKIKKLTKMSTTQVTGEVIAMVRDLGGTDVIVVDETGLGSGVVDELNEAKNTPDGPAWELLRQTEIRGVQFGAGVECDGGSECEHKSCSKTKFVNLKARMFRLLADDLKDGLTLLQEDIYLDELPTIIYRYDSKGRMVMESKDDYKKRTGRGSPDHADSLALANYGRHDELSVGVFGGSFTSGFGTPNAGSLRGERAW